MTRIIQLIQLLHATLLCHPELYKIQGGDDKHKRRGKRKFDAIVKSLNPIMSELERNMPEDLIEALYDEQNNTMILLEAVMDLNPEQAVELINLFKEAKLIKP